MCACTPTKRTPVCDDCPEELRRSWKMVPNATPDEALAQAIETMRESVIGHGAAGIQQAAAVHKHDIELRDLHALVTHLMTKIEDRDERIEAMGVQLVEANRRVDHLERQFAIVASQAAAAARRK